MIRALLMNEAGGDMGGGGGDTGGSAAPSAPASTAGLSEVGNYSGDTPANDNGIAASQSTDPKPAGGKHKLRRLGQDVELSLDELIAAASDSHPYELELGKGQDGNPIRKSVQLPELLRSARLGEAAFVKMREAAELRKSYEGARERGRGDVAWYMREHLGVEDPEDWAVQQASGRLKRQRELHELLQSDPAEYHKQVTADERARVEREAAAREAAQKREADARAAQERAQQLAQQVPEALAAAGLPATNEMGYRLAQIVRKYESVGHNITMEEGAHLVAEGYRQELTGYLSQMPVDALLGLLGKDLRKTLREAEIKALKGAEKQKQASQAQASSEPQTHKPKSRGSVSWLGTKG